MLDAVFVSPEAEVIYLKWRLDINVFLGIGSFLFNIVSFNFLYFDIYALLANISSVLIFVSDNFCHLHKMLSLSTNEIFTGKVFHYC